VPTLDVWPAVDRQFAKGAFHWFLFAQPGDLPERMLAADPDAFLDATLNQMAGGIENSIPPLWPLTAKRFVRLQCAMR
jgi:haloacetate dehalogenase